MNLDWAWIQRELPMIGSLLVEHIVLAVLPVLIAFIVSLPLGFLVSKMRRATNVVLAFLGVIYSIPSLALFVLMPLILGTKILNQSTSSLRSRSIRRRYWCAPLWTGCAQCRQR